mgnify:CR=1 FL=1
MPSMTQAEETVVIRWPAGLPGAAGSSDSVPEPRRYLFGEGDEYEIIMADSLELRLRAWALVYRCYADKGYARESADGLWYGLHDALPSTRTFLVTRSGRDVATLSLVFDSPLHLPADAVYGDELDALRARNRRTCEMISLVSEESSTSRRMEVLKHLFKLAYLTASRLEGASDMVITVHPHHAAFYERRLMFERVGEERDYGKVGGAPAILLRLDLEQAEALYAERYGADEGSFLRFFVNPETEPGVLAFLAQRGTGLSRRELDLYFDEKRPLLSRAPAGIREHVREFYPNGDDPAWAALDAADGRMTCQWPALVIGGMAVRECIC